MADVAGRFHRQVSIKVNALVDQGIAELVMALNAFPALQTVESCEGTKGGPWVCFTYGDSRECSWKPIAEFILEFLAPRLFTAVGDAASIALRPTVNGTVLVDLTVRPEGLQSVQKAVLAIAEEFIRARSLACSGDTSGTVL